MGKKSYIVSLGSDEKFWFYVTADSYEVSTKTTSIYFITNDVIICSVEKNDVYMIEEISGDDIIVREKYERSDKNERLQ